MTRKKKNRGPSTPRTVSTIIAEHPVVEAVVEQTKVTSPKGKLNTRDWLVSVLGSIGMVLFTFISTIIHLVAQLLDAIADYAVPYLQSIPKHDRPAWLAMLTFTVMGIIILNKRRTAGPNYVPPQAGTLPVQNPAAPSVPAPQGQPPAAGTADTSKSAF